MLIRFKLPLVAFRFCQLEGVTSHHPMPFELLACRGDSPRILHHHLRAWRIASRTVPPTPTVARIISNVALRARQGRTALWAFRQLDG